ncbi:MAG: glycerol dehydratase reactivase beta/small subunit family protein [Defluviitaleaceae bacterium]|nr:glycerol dehydratase reactivase beta/small subunit family protein [Defluviitaleaceae bacterium]
MLHIYEANASPEALKEICAGLEEEGILYSIFSKTSADVKTLAFDAANHSKLRVGIGIAVSTAALQIRNCPIDKPVFLIDSDYRALGTNAGRAVKGGVFV